MSKWYIEFEVENKEAEIRFWNCIERIGQCACEYIQNYTSSCENDLINAALDFAAEMKYID